MFVRSEKTYMFLHGRTQMWKLVFTVEIGVSPDAIPT